MWCHLAGIPERLALDPKLNQGLRRKNQPGLVCSSTDYKGLGGFFYLPLWYGPNHGCQFSPLVLGILSAYIFSSYSLLFCARLLLCFVFILRLPSVCTFISDTFMLCFFMTTYTILCTVPWRAFLSQGINNFPEAIVMLIPI